MLKRRLNETKTYIHITKLATKNLCIMSLERSMGNRLTKHEKEQISVFEQEYEHSKRVNSIFWYISNMFICFWLILDIKLVLFKSRRAFTWSRNLLFYYAEKPRKKAFVWVLSWISRTKSRLVSLSRNNTCRGISRAPSAILLNPPPPPPIPQCVSTQGSEPQMMPLAGVPDLDPQLFGLFRPNM